MTSTSLSAESHSRLLRTYPKTCLGSKAANVIEVLDIGHDIRFEHDYDEGIDLGIKRRVHCALKDVILDQEDGDLLVFGIPDVIQRVNRNFSKAYAFGANET